ncbi:hypothetical protein [Flavobacterium sp.]|uniref:hypothetical protein n=1 Tax=Flavobacterium sp. TaxID=239 RepID=UPI0024874957|nr:hypothetical protein [Flavobacterium sp.]MDI1318167.1 hypothetical protein [Flavobacterium sp.]
MKKIIKTPKKETTEDINKTFPAYPVYPPSEDIYNNANEETEIDPEDISKKKPSHSDDGKFNEKNFNQDKSGSDLDIPGSELDDEQEDIGSEDEENNGYSIGGDNHNDLEEDNG